MIKNLNRVIVLLLLFSFSVGCSSYKSSWDCPKAKGIGCSSLEYADEMAREQILLNTDKYKSNNFKQVGKYSNDKSSSKDKDIKTISSQTTKAKENKVLLNQDLLGGEEYEVIEINS